MPLALLTAACGGDVTVAAGDEHAAADVCGRSGGAGVPADRGGPAPDGGAVVLAADRLLVGDRSEDGLPDPEAWQALGYDIDCRVTTDSSNDVCKGGPHRSDAPGGRDNNFGRLILPLLTAVDVDSQIATGRWTLLLRLDALGPQPTQSGLAATLYEGRDLGHPPALDGSDTWPVASPQTLAGSYVVDGTWVSGTPVTLRLPFDVWEGDEITTFYLTLHHAIVTALLSADRSSATHGQIAGIIDADELSIEVKRVGAVFEPFSCQTLPANPDFSDAADILLDGTQDPGETCNGISAGLGLTLRGAHLGEAVDAQVPLDPCTPDGP